MKIARFLRANIPLRFQTLNQKGNSWPALHSIQTMNSDEKKNSLFNSLPTVPTEPPSLSPTESSLSSLAPLSMPALQLEKADPPSPLRAALSLECYFVDYDPLDGKYRTVKVNEQDPGFFLREIVNLILSYVRVHVKSVPKTAAQNRTLLPKVMKPIVFPVLDSKKYAFVFETCEWRMAESGVEASDRFVIFVCDDFLPYTLSELVKAITREEYQDRLRLFQFEEGDSANPPSLASRTAFLSFIDGYLRSSKKFYFSKQGDLACERSQQLQWYLRQASTYTVLIRMNTLHYRPMLLLTLLLHYSIREYKILLVGSKENRHIMSESAIALRTALAPVDYCYPLVFAAISDRHEDYMDAPVPCLVCYWGEERDCERMRGKYRRLSEEGAMPTILIDLNSFTAFNSVGSEGQARAMLEMNEFILGQRTGEGSAVERANRFMREELMECSREVLREQSQIFKKSLCYQHYQQQAKK